jgi:ATP-dependent helicase HepA
MSARASHKAGSPRCKAISSPVSACGGGRGAARLAALETRNNWRQGQRWVSENEPELGLGIVRSAGDGRVDMRFPAVGETRCYATDSAPLRRVRFSPGDRIDLESGGVRVVDGVEESGGLLVYQTAEGPVMEADLASAMSFNKPDQRLFAGSVDDPAEFDLRCEALWRRAEIRRSPVRGMVGARMDLIPHQLFIADEVSSRLRPRVLLADEVGLGKTIEACLILHRLMLTGRVGRVLVLVPEALTHQWFVELLRRFHLPFALFDEERCESITRNDPEANPFLDSQWVLAGLDFVSGNPTRGDQLADAGWDALVVDEAHHLEWAREWESPAYQLVSRIAARTGCVLLLTATPRHSGPEGHFARLRLLDPSRYADLAEFHEQGARDEKLADLVEAVIAGSADHGALARWVEGKPMLEARMRDLLADRDGAEGRMADALLDSFGAGRVMFRNTRKRLGGFPARRARLVPLRGGHGEDPVVSWLVRFLKRKPSEKVLVILRTREGAEQMLASLTDQAGVAAVAFHEGLTLLQRDRNAAFFADEDGARVLICSEMGGEGRNFQFAGHLALADLPDDLDLLEQRIGRLDRIGRRGTIHIHVPYRAGTAEEVWARWLDEGLDAFRQSPPGAAEIRAELGGLLAEVMDTLDQAMLAELISRTRVMKREMERRMARGQDRLLALRSHQPERAARVAEEIRRLDDDAGFENFVVRLMEHAGMHVEPLAPRRWFLRPDALKSGAFPSLPADGMTVTFERRRALEREHEGFMTQDHPMVRAALDELLGSAAGNAAFGVWRAPGEKRLLLECLMLAECVAPAALEHERYLPQTPLRVMIDQHGADRTDEDGFAPAALRKGNPAALLGKDALRRRVIPMMLDRARAIAEAQCRALAAAAKARMEREIAGELLRLRELAMVNDHIDAEEARLLEARRDGLRRCLTSPRVRLDAVRLIWKGPS